MSNDWKEYESKWSLFVIVSQNFPEGIEEKSQKSLLMMDSCQAKI
jgi:hypothetical protein